MRCHITCAEDQLKYSKFDLAIDQFTTQIRPLVLCVSRLIDFEQSRFENGAVICNDPRVETPNCNMESTLCELLQLELMHDKAYQTSSHMRKQRTHVCALQPDKPVLGFWQSYILIGLKCCLVSNCKLSLGKVTDRGCLRTWFWGEYMDLKGTKQQEEE
jgi:hypothetical protein